MRIILLILLFFTLTANAQTFTPTAGEHVVTIAGHVCRYYYPQGYDTVATSRLRFLLAFSPEDNGNKMDTTQLTKYFISGAWNGKTAKVFGDTLRFVYFVIPSMGFTASDYDTCINAAILSFNRIDTSLHETFGITAYTSAVPLALLWKNSGRAALTTLFQKGVFIQSSQTFQSYAWSSTGKWRFWYSSTDPNPTYAGSYTSDIYDAFSGSKSIQSVNIPVHNATIWDSCMTIWGLNYSTGGTAATNRVRFLGDPDDGIVYENEIEVDTLDLIDLVGAPVNVKYFFDDTTSNPERGIYNNDETIDLPTVQDGRYYPSKYLESYGKREWRFAAHLRGEHHVKKIYYHVLPDAFYTDSLLFYKTEDFITFTRLAAVNIPITGSNYWDFVTVDDTTRNIVIGIRRAYNSTFFSYGTPQVSEIKLYGDPVGSRSPALSFKGYPRPLRSVDQLVGIDMILGYESQEKMAPFKNQRIMQDATWMLDDLFQSTTYFNFDHFNELAFGPERTQKGMLDSAKYHGRYATLNLNSGSQALQDSGLIGIRQNYLLSNPYQLNTYSISGQFMYTIGKAYGQVPYDTSFMRMLYKPRFSADTMNPIYYAGWSNNMNIGNGNELNGFWKVPDTALGLRFQDNLSYAMNSQLDYDGYESRYGDTIGMVNADPNIRMSEATLYEIDKSVHQSRYLMAREMRTDRKNIFGRVQLNKYWHTESGTLEGLHPVEDSASFKLKSYATNVFSIDSSVELEYTEVGYDANTGSVQCVPRTGSSWTDREWQAICNAYVLFESTGAYFDRMYYYVMTTNQDEANDNRFATSDFAASFLDGNPVNIRRNTWYYTANAVRLLTGYVEESVLSYVWNGKYLKKYRSLNNRDSVAYVIGKAATDGSTLTDATIPTGEVIGTPVVHNLSFTAETTSTSSISPVSGILTIPVVSEKPLIILVQEIPQTSGTFRNILRHTKFRN